MQRLSLPVQQLIAAIWIVVCVLFAKHSYVAFMQNGLDFSLYYSIGELFKIGQPELIYTSGEQGPYYAYSPLVAPFFWFLTLLPYSICKIVFFVLKVFCMALWPWILGLVTSTQSETSSSSMSRHVSIGMLASIIALPTVFEETMVGNINLFLLTILFCAFALTRLNMITIGAALITLIAAFKPQYSLFFVPALLMGPMRAIIGGSITTSALVILSLVIYGPTNLFSLLETWTQLIASPIAGPEDANNQSTFAVITRYFTPLTLSMSGSLQGINLFSFPLSTSSIIAKVFGWCMTFGLAFSIWKTWLYRRKQFLQDAYASIILLTLIMTPVVWLTHFMLIVIPVHVMLESRMARSRIAVSVIAFLVFLSLMTAGQYRFVEFNVIIFSRAYGLIYWAMISLSLFFIINTLIRTRHKKSSFAEALS
jgi:hypothetical protein